MAEEDLAVFQDVFFNSTVTKLENNEDSFPLFDLTYLDTSIDLDDMSDLYPKEDEITYMDQYFSSPSLDISQTISISSTIYPDTQLQHIVPSNSPSMEQKYQLSVSLSFINPPESSYHVRYQSEITNSSPDGNVENTRMNTKKHVSGRYLKGTHGRYITIRLPEISSDKSNLFIRVTRLTVPYQDTSFIHPYSLFYSYPKKNTHHSDVITQGASVYFKLNKEDMCSHSKRFPHLILTRLKQCQLKNINNLVPFANSERSHPFIGRNAKEKIATYQLKKSQLDFRLVFRCEQTGGFFGTNIFCRSDELLEEEGIECKKSSTR